MSAEQRTTAAQEVLKETMRGSLIDRKAADRKIGLRDNWKEIQSNHKKKKNQRVILSLFNFYRHEEPRREGEHDQGYIMTRDVCNNDTQCVSEYWISAQKVVGLRICILEL